MRDPAGPVLLELWDTPLSQGKFCHACAHPVAASAGTPSRSPDSHTPKHLAEKILTSRSALEGERKQVTVLFADLKGSMELLADRDPEEARKILDPVLELIMEAVHRYEGTVNQVMGDGIMALFVAPIGHEDHAVRGCYAALRMLGEHERVLRYLREAEALAERLHDRWRPGRAHARLTTHFWLMGDLDRALESGEQAATTAAAVGDLGLKVEANLILGQVHTTRGVTRRAIEFFTTNVGILQGELLREQPGMVGAAVLSRVWLSYCLGAYGEFQAAVAVGEEARGIAESFDSPFGLIGAYNAIGMAHLFRGDVRAAVLVLERGLELCRSHGFGAWLPPIASSLGQAYVMAGRVSEGVALQEEAVEASHTRNRADEVGRMSRLSMAYLLAGRRAEATSLAHRALELARGQKQRGPEAGVRARPDCRPERATGGRDRRDLLSSGHRVGRGARTPSAPGTKPPWSRHALSAHG
jgi:tetratricopeptide (TPR) repeat protein